jgi:hypothetical protein
MKTKKILKEREYKIIYRRELEEDGRIEGSAIVEIEIPFITKGQAWYYIGQLVGLSEEEVFNKLEESEDKQKLDPLLEKGSEIFDSKYQLVIFDLPKEIKNPIEDAGYTIFFDPWEAYIPKEYL